MGLGLGEAQCGGVAARVGITSHSRNREWGPKRLVSPYSREECCASQLAKVWASWVSGSLMSDLRLAEDTLIPDSGLALDTFIEASGSVVGEEAPSKFLGFCLASSL